MKLAGTNRKLSAANYAAMTSRLTPAETAAGNRQALAVVPENCEFDESDSPFFARERGASNLSDGEISVLDAMIEAHGVADVLKSIETLLESRVEDGVMQGGTLLLHMSRHNAFARAAERLRDLAFHPDIATL